MWIVHKRCVIVPYKPICTICKNFVSRAKLFVNDFYVKIIYLIRFPCELYMCIIHAYPSYVMVHFTTFIITPSRDALRWSEMRTVWYLFTLVGFVINYGLSVRFGVPSTGLNHRPFQGGDPSFNHGFMLNAVVCLNVVLPIYQSQHAVFKCQPKLYVRLGMCQVYVRYASCTLSMRNCLTIVQHIDIIFIWTNIFIQMRISASF